MTSDDQRRGPDPGQARPQSLAPRPSVLHRNAPLSPEGRLRPVQRCQHRPIAHGAAEMGISRACASKWVNRYRRHGELGLLDRSSTPRCQPTATSSDVVARIEALRRAEKWSATRIAFELQAEGISLSRRTVSRHLLALGLNRRRFIDPSGDPNREPRRITARRPGHMVHIDVKKVGRIPDGGGRRVHGRGSHQAKTVERRKNKGARGGYVYLHSAVGGFSRLHPQPALRTPTPRRPRHLEHPLQLPPTPRCSRRPTAGLTTTRRRDRRPGLIHLAGRACATRAAASYEDTAQRALTVRNSALRRVPRRIRASA